MTEFTSTKHAQRHRSNMMFSSQNWRRDTWLAHQHLHQNRGEGGRAVLQESGRVALHQLTEGVAEAIQHLLKGHDLMVQVLGLILVPNGFLLVIEGAEAR